MTSHRKVSKVTVKKRAQFLHFLSETANVSQSARLACLGRRHLYRFRAANEDFAAKWDRALDAGADALEAEARRRAVSGTEEPVFYQGEVCGHVRRYSDTLLIFLLKGARPEKYSERRQVSGPDGGPQEHRMVQSEFMDRLLAHVDGKTRGLPGPHEMPPDESDDD